MGNEQTISLQIDAGSDKGYSGAERQLAEQFLREHYDVLLRIARAKRRRVGAGNTFNTTELIHDAIVRLNGRADFACSEHFLRACVLAMRHVIIDYARRKLTTKHGSGQQSVDFDAIEGALPEFGESPEQLVAIDELLAQLEEQNPRWLQVVDARYFGGMTETEASLALGISERTIRRDWRDARDWLAERVAPV